MLRPILLAGLILAAPVVVSATTYVVNPEGTGDFATIQAAIDAAVTGDVIELADGTFTGDGNRDMDYLGKAITIRSQGGSPELCVIDCQGSEVDPHRGFHFQTGEQVGSVLTGVTITGGWIGYPDFGGAACCEGPSAPSFNGCVFSANTGSAIYCKMGSGPTFDECVFTANHAEMGAGIWGDRCALTIRHCAFTDNVAEQAAAVEGYEVQAVVTNCTFLRNTASHAAAVLFQDQSATYIADCLFEGNVSLEQGGALTYWISYPNTLERCTFVGNVAAYEGAAIWSEKVSDVYVKDCTFWGNGSPDGTIVAGNNRFVIENSIVAFGTVGPGVASYYDYAELSCCDVFGNAGGDWVGSIADQYGINGNICEDPLFCNPENGDFHISCNSPCVPFSPQNPECDLLGAWPVGCGGSPVVRTTWGAVKAMFGE